MTSANEWGDDRQTRGTQRVRTSRPVVPHRGSDFSCNPDDVEPSCRGTLSLQSRSRRRVPAMCRRCDLLFASHFSVATVRGEGRLAGTGAARGARRPRSRFPAGIHLAARVARLISDGGSGRDSKLDLPDHRRAIDAWSRGAAAIQPESWRGRSSRTRELPNNARSSRRRDHGYAVLLPVHCEVPAFRQLHESRVSARLRPRGPTRCCSADRLRPAPTEAREEPAASANRTSLEDLAARGSCSTSG